MSRKPHVSIYPYSYKAIAIVAMCIFLVAFLIGSRFIKVNNYEGASLLWTVASFLWRFTRGLFIPLCLLCLFLCISNVALLYREGFRLNNFLGFIFSGAYLTIINILWIPLREMPPVMTRAIVFGRLIACYLECTILAICVVGFCVLKIKPKYDKDFAIILGCSISKKGKLRPLLRGRVNAAMKFAWRQEWETEKPVRYVPSGGQGPDEPLSEGSAMALYLESHGAEEYEVFTEKQSKNTYENLVFSKRIIDEIQKNAKVVIVTTNYHVLRSGMLARRIGLDAEMVGSGTKWYFWPNAFFREIVAILTTNLKVHVAVAVICVLVALLL